MASRTAESSGPRVDDIEHVIDVVSRHVFGAWKKLLIAALVIGTLALLIIPNLNAWAQYILYGAMMAFQLLFAVLFMVVQFVALFWFLARPRVYWVMPGETGVGFKDYKGNGDVLEVARRVVTLLRGVKEFRQMGGEVTRGILLVGPPGTGKSYLAQCISTEAGVPFGYLSAPSIQSMFMGVSNLTIMRLYGKARKLAQKFGACILFIDEIDAIGGRRSGQTGPGFGGAMGGMFGGGSSGLLNELLLQMDPPPQDLKIKDRMLRRLGLRIEKATMPPVLTMGATNLAEVLDPALLRPGRFDRKIAVDLPDFAGRKEIIEYYIEKVARDNLSLDKLAYDTIGYSPAAIKFVVNEAVINAHFNGRAQISYRDWSLALENHELGLRHPIRNMTIADKRGLAYHEAGHAVAQFLLLPKERLNKVTIIRHGQALGLSQSKPKEESYTASREELLADVQVSLASRASEELFLNTRLNGVTSNLQSATHLAWLCVGAWGMNGTLFSSLAFGGQPDGHQREEVEKILRDQFIRAKQLLDENRDLLIAVAETLLQKLELDGDEVRAIADEVQRRKALGLPIHEMPSLDAPVSGLDLLPDASPNGVTHLPPTRELERVAAAQDPSQTEVS